MSAYCNEYWTLWRAKCRAGASMNASKESDYFLASAALTEHRETCPICKEHTRAMLEMSREAIKPEYEEE